MTYREQRTVVLPDGRLVEELRIQSGGDVTYRYENAGRPADLSNLQVEYNGQVLAAREPDVMDLFGVDVLTF